MQSFRGYCPRRHAPARRRIRTQIYEDEFNCLEAQGSCPLKKFDYVLGHSQREIRRLIYQAALLEPITERLLRNAQIRPGMRVLDLGCSAGDLSMLAATLVGPTGLVIGIT